MMKTTWKFRHWCIALLGVGALLGSGCNEVSSPTAGDSQTSSAQQRVAQQNENVAEGDTQATSIRPDRDVVQIKTIAPEKVRVGEEYQYEVQVVNSSDSAAVRQVKVRQTLPEGFEISKATPEAKQEDRAATWTIPQLDPGETKTIQVTATSDQEGASTACLSVTYTPTICLNTQFVKPEVAVTKEAPEQATLCERLRFVYRVSNDGSGTAKQITIKDQLPEGLQTVEGEQTVQLTVDELAAGQKREFPVEVVAQKAGQFNSRAVASLAGGEEIRSANVGPEVRAAKLDVEIEGPPAAYLGRMVNYQIRVKNTGNAAANDAMLWLKHPGQARVAWRSEPKLVDLAQNQSADKSRSAEAAEERGEGEQPTPADPSSAPDARSAASARDANKPKVEGSKTKAEESQSQPRLPQLSRPGDGMESIAFRLGSIEPGQTAQATVGLIGGSQEQLQVQAIAAFQCGAQDERPTATSTAQTRIIALPALALSVVDTPDPVAIGEEVRYIITVLNEGNAEDQDIQVTAKLPDSMEYVKSAGQSEGQAEGSQVTFPAVEELRPDQRVSWTIHARAKSEGSAQIQVTLKSQNQEETSAEEPTKLFQGSGG